VLKPFIEADCVLWDLGQDWRGELA